MITKNTVNSKKNIAVFVAVSLVFGIMIGLGIQTSNAQGDEFVANPTQKSPKSYGSATADKFCGERLCTDPPMGFNIEEDHTIGEIDYDDPAAPSAELISISKYKPSTNKQDAITYKITYRLIAGEVDLKDIQIRAISDMGVWNFEISSLNAISSSVNVVRIKALDPDSIHGGIIGYTITGPTGQFER